MKGPTAPKDPEKRRPFFYIIRGKNAGWQGNPVYL